MKLNNKGFTGVEVLAVALGIFVIGTLVPQINPLNWFKEAGRPNTETKDYNTTEKVKTPLFYEGKEGTEVAYKEEIRTSKGKDVFIHKLTWNQKFANWMGNLSGFGLIGFILAIAAGWISPIAIFARLRYVWKSAFKNQTKGLKNIKDTIVQCRDCKSQVTIDTKKEAFEDVEAKMDKRDIVLQEVVKTELAKRS